MGAFKNQLIAEQVEEADRVPAPKPATSHVAFTRAQLKAIRKASDQALRKTMREAVYLAVLGFTFGAVFGIALVSAFVWL